MAMTFSVEEGARLPAQRTQQSEKGYRFTAVTVRHEKRKVRSGDEH